MNPPPEGSQAEVESRVIPLGTDPIPEPVVPPTPPSRVHGLAISGMAMFALVGIVAMFLFVTVNWPDDTGRWVIGTLFVCGLGFIGCASAAVFSAARDTYARGGTGGDRGSSDSGSR